MRICSSITRRTCGRTGRGSHNISLGRSGHRSHTGALFVLFYNLAPVVGTTYLLRQIFKISNREVGAHCSAQQCARVPFPTRLSIRILNFVLRLPVIMPKYHTRNRSTYICIRVFYRKKCTAVFILAAVRARQEKLELQTSELLSENS